MESVAARPTSITEVARKHRMVTGACDAAKPGMGEVAFGLTNSLTQPVCWKHRFPQKILQCTISNDNPDDDLTNSNLGLAGVVTHHDVLAHM